MDPRPVAVFDIDGTLFRSSLVLELTEELIQRGIFPHEARSIYEGAKEDWQNRKGEYEPFIRNVVKAFATYAKGALFEEVSNIAGEIIESHKDRVYRYTRDLAHAYKDKGYYLLAISHSPKFIVDGFAFELGFDKSYGTYYETGASDRFTGTILDEHLIMNKANILKRAVEKHELSLHGSVGVGDTESDISMLTMVETPIAFNPNRALYRHALQHNWKIVVERKDVIYEL
ncbi:MAG TPA: HAD-IB family hydrolase [Candidatus Paceibacterota bacterium]|nr:HAD-IB family hydrolase [Candidatus Paceibacterota bacterium]